LFQLLFTSKNKLHNTWEKRVDQQVKKAKNKAYEFIEQKKEIQYIVKEWREE
jgi:vacuolar-type H+-ATPase catalytic subunit A/Vma1